MTDGDLLNQAIGLLLNLEWSVLTHAKTGKDTVECPACGASTIVGLEGHHTGDCRLKKFLDTVAQLDRVALENLGWDDEELNRG